MVLVALAGLAGLAWYLTRARAQGATTPAPPGDGIGVLPPPGFGTPISPPFIVQPINGVQPIGPGITEPQLGRVIPDPIGAPRTPPITPTLPAPPGGALADLFAGPMRVRWDGPLIPPAVAAEWNRVRQRILAGTASSWEITWFQRNTVRG